MHALFAPQSHSASVRIMNRLGAAVAVLVACSLAAACGSGSGSACWKLGRGCACGGERPTGTVDFSGTCNENGVGERGICCQAAGSCRCIPVHCGISSFSGVCLCGADPLISSTVASCTGTASTCCTQDTGYCYCEEGCQDRFENRLVTSCELTTSAATCNDSETRVSSC